MVNFDKDSYIYDILELEVANIINKERRKGMVQRTRTPIYIDWTRPNYINNNEAEIIMEMVEEKAIEDELDFDYFYEEEEYTLIFCERKKEKPHKRGRKK